MARPTKPAIRHPALSLLEFATVAAGIRAADAMVKRAPIALLKAGTVHPGRFLALCGGSVAAVAEAHAEGLARGADRVLDETFLPEADAGLVSAALGERLPLAGDALGVFETRGAAALLRGVDAAVKGAAVRIAELRLADDLGGRAFALLDGLLEDVEAALEIGAARLDRDQVVDASLLPRLDGDLRRLLDAGTRFAPCALVEPEGAELPATKEEVGDAAG